jgi:5-formyltetrahydrofolate cyclo-ligase
MSSKSEIRSAIRAVRDSLDVRARSTAAEKIHRQLLALDAVRDAAAWFVYASCGSEVQTHELIRALSDRGDIVTIPRIVGSGKMIARQIHAFEELRLGEFGILAPPAGEAYSGTIDVCVCPGLAFSEAGHRLGSGRGFYDRYLAANAPRLAIGLALECQIRADLPTEVHDRPMDFVITEERVIRCG